MLFAIKPMWPIDPITMFTVQFCQCNWIFDDDILFSEKQWAPFPMSITSTSLPGKRLHSKIAFHPIKAFRSPLFKCQEMPLPSLGLSGLFICAWHKFIWFEIYLELSKNSDNIYVWFHGYQNFASKKAFLSPLCRVNTQIYVLLIPLSGLFIWLLRSEAPYRLAS